MEKEKPSPLRLVALTWNMSGRDNARSLAEWRKDDILHDKWANLVLLMTSGYGMNADVIVVALQEVYMAGSNVFGEYFGSLVQSNWMISANQLGHRVSNTSTYMGMVSSSAASFDQQLHVFWNRTRWPDLDIDKEAEVCFGTALPFLPASCLKASLGVRMWVRGKEKSTAPVFVVASHLPMVDTGIRGDAARTAAWQLTRDEVLRKQLYPDRFFEMSRGIRDPRGPEETDAVYNDRVLASQEQNMPHTTVWLGDLNFRTDQEHGDRLTYLRQEEGHEMQALLRAYEPSILSAPFSFARGWRECGQTQPPSPFESWRPRYTPTCKMRTLEDFMMMRQDRPEDRKERAKALIKARLNGDRLAYAQIHEREPSWCDRIFSYSVTHDQRHATLWCDVRKAAGGMLLSDHDGVVAQLNLNEY